MTISNGQRTFDVICHSQLTRTPFQSGLLIIGTLNTRIRDQLCTHSSCTKQNISWINTDYFDGKDPEQKHCHIKSIVVKQIYWSSCLLVNETHIYFEPNFRLTFKTNLNRVSTWISSFSYQSTWHNLWTKCYLTALNWTQPLESMKNWPKNASRLN